MSRLIIIGVIAALVLAFIAVSLIARRLDRLHVTVVKSRRALELALRARSEYARELAESGALDVASSILLADAAQACIAAGHYPIVNDGLDGVTNPGAEDRRNLESALSRTLRLTVDELEEGSPALERLNKARLDVRLTRTFHNSHVDQIRRLRKGAVARVFHTAGRAPLPETVDIDDE